MASLETSERSTRWDRWTPGPADLVFGIVLLSVLVGGRFRILNDPGTFWHVQLGRDVLATGRVPRADALTWTHVGTPWVDQSWLFDTGLAALVDRWGWSAGAVASALLLAVLYASVTAGLIREGCSPLAAVVVGVLASGIGATHFLVRPHLMTLALVWATLRLCRLQHERGGWWVAWTPVVTALWANLHGGFLAAPIVVATAALGHLIDGPFPWDRKRLRGTAPFVLAAFACVAAALVNPYGFGLYRHVGALLYSSGVTELIEEYQPIPFGKGDARVVEWVVLALIALPTLASCRMTRYELAHSLVWLHLALVSVRHAPIFALAVAPGLARLLDGALQNTRQSPESVPPGPTHAWSPWPVVGALSLVVACVAGAPFGRFDPAHWPLAALPELNRVSPEVPLFHEQDWGGLVESECRPRRGAFIDDRFELFGREEVFRYLNALQGGPDWDAIRDQRRIGLVWLRPDRGLARRLESDPAWVVLHRDGVSVLLGRKDRGREPDGSVARVGRGSDRPGS